MSKPGPHDAARLEEYAATLRGRLRVAGRVRVITHPRGNLGMPGAALSTLRLRPGGGGHDSETDDVGPRRTPTRRSGPADCEPAAVTARRVEVLAIGASTGGPQALARLLAGVPADTTAAIVVVQHMADGFMEGLTDWLDESCPLPVVLGVHGKRMSPGTVTIAPSGLNLIVHDRLRITTSEPAPGQFHVPGIDATFTSVADAYGSMAVGLLLTGMGRDGALGLKRIRDCGGFTIGQDESTSAVYGMPAAAMSADAVDVQLPLPEICTAIAQLLGATDEPVATP
jgi:two-component system chemotaxis response regulator CheB